MRGTFLFPKSPQTEKQAMNPGPDLRVLATSVLCGSSRAWRTGTRRRERREMDECQTNTMWPEQMEEWLRTAACFLLQFVFCSPCVSLSHHSSIKRGEKNGCNLFLTLFLTAFLRQLHTFDRTLISDVKKSRKRQKNTDGSPS